MYRNFKFNYNFQCCSKLNAYLYKHGSYTPHTAHVHCTRGSYTPHTAHVHCTQLIYTYTVHVHAPQCHNAHIEMVCTQSTMFSERYTFLPSSASCTFHTVCLNRTLTTHTGIKTMLLQGLSVICRILSQENQAIRV